MELGSRRKAGFSTYPQAPLSWNRPWYTSISGPGVWKFKATTGRTEQSQAVGWPQGPQSPACLGYTEAQSHTVRQKQGLGSLQCLLPSCHPN